MGFGISPHLALSEEDLAPAEKAPPDSLPDDTLRDLFFSHTEKMIAAHALIALSNAAPAASVATAFNNHHSKTNFAAGKAGPGFGR